MEKPQKSFNSREVLRKSISKESDRKDFLKDIEKKGSRKEGKCVFCQESDKRHNRIKDLIDAIKEYMDYYTNKRPQRKLGVLTPMEYHQKILLAA